MQTIICAVVAIVLMGGNGSAAAPSVQLLTTLDTRLEAAPRVESNLSTNLIWLYQRLMDADVKSLPRIAVEYAGSAQPRVKALVPAGTLRAQLDALTSSAGYTWQADEDWIHLIPGGKAGDEDYVLNRRLEGTVTLSRDPAKCTPATEWLKMNRIVVLRDAHSVVLGKEPKKLNGPVCPDPAAVENPTLRQILCRHEALYGNEYSTVRVKTFTDPDDGLVWTTLVTWGQSLKPVPLPTTPSK